MPRDSQVALVLPCSSRQVPKPTCGALPPQRGSPVGHCRRGRARLWGTAAAARLTGGTKLTEARRWQCPHDVNGKVAAPLFSIFHATGWKRAVAAATVATLAMKFDTEWRRRPKAWTSSSR